jgi:AraC-like DNA-binding protein
MQHKITPLILSPRRQLQTLVENRTAYTLNQCELNVFETYQQSFDVALNFNDLVITSMLRGKKVMHLFNQPEFEYLPGESVIVPANANMKIDFPTAQEHAPTQCIALAINPQQISNTIQYLNEFFPKADPEQRWQLNFNACHLQNNQDIASILNKIISICIGDQRDKDILVDLSMKELLVCIMQMQNLKVIASPAMSAGHPLAYVIEYIRANLSEKISIKNLSDKACMSKASFYRLFKREFGISPNDFIIKEKISRAKQLLKKPDAKISAVGYELGFNDTNYFIRLFKKMVGITPGNYHHQQ